MGAGLLFLALLLPFRIGRAETRYKDTATRLSRTTRKRTANPVVSGFLDLRPGMSTTTGDLNSENSIGLGTGLSPSTALSYVQEFNSVNSEGTQDLQMGDGSLRLHLGSLWERKDWNISFSDQVRIYFPTVSQKRDAGMILSIRNYFIWRMQVSESVAFEFCEVPIVHIYNEDGVVNEAGASANPSFENRIMVGPSFRLAERITLGATLHFYTQKFRDFDPAAQNNDEWIPTLFFWPEINFALSSGFYTGFGYRTENLMTTTTGGTTLADGLGTGLFQAIFGVSF